MLAEDVSPDPTPRERTRDGGGRQVPFTMAIAGRVLLMAPSCALAPLAGEAMRTAVYYPVTKIDSLFLVRAALPHRNRHDRLPTTARDIPSRLPCFPFLALECLAESPAVLC